MTAPITITLDQIRAYNPCVYGWKKLVQYLGPTQASDEPFPFEKILDSNGLEDAFWCLTCLGPEHDDWIWHLAVEYAERVRHLLTGERLATVLNYACRYADGLVTAEDLGEVRDALRIASWDAAWILERAAADAGEAAAGRDAARNAERQWQANRFREYLRAGGRPEG